MLKQTIEWDMQVMTEIMHVTILIITQLPEEINGPRCFMRISHYIMSIIMDRSTISS